MQNDFQGDTGFWTIPVKDIRFRGDAFSNEVTPLKSNVQPIIVIEYATHYDLLDGWGRVSGLRNAGAEKADAVLVSRDDLATRCGTDDHEWNAAMLAKYAPGSTYSSTN